MKNVNPSGKITVLVLVLAVGINGGGIWRWQVVRSNCSEASHSSRPLPTHFLKSAFTYVNCSSLKLISNGGAQENKLNSEWL